ncbi:MAG: hypothetical protein QOF22_1579, partial [Bradyrhizobium sp.]|nr:hypothetical protein [Bradyrhizobium sp.]
LYLKKMQVHELGISALRTIMLRWERIRPPDEDGLMFKFGCEDQITGFQAAGISRYFVPSFSTYPTAGKAKWKPTTTAFSAAAMS